MLNELYELRTIKDVLLKINEKYPGWIVDILSDYSNDYDCLRQSWVTVLTTKSIPRQKIIVVSSISNDDHIVLAELLSQSGFLIRTSDEIQCCSHPGCGLALITENRFMELKEKNTNLLPHWLPKCSYHYQQEGGGLSVV